MALINCPRCNGLCTDTAQFCSTCDFNFTKYRMELAQGSKVCSKCSTVNPLSYTTCLKCGSTFTETTNEPIKTEQPKVETPTVSVQQTKTETPIIKEEPKAEVPPIQQLKEPVVAKTTKTAFNKSKIGLIIGVIIAVLVLFKYVFHSCNNSNVDNESTPNTSETFNGQTLKQGERIVKVNWGKERTATYSSDRKGYEHYSSPTLVVPSGKKWVLLYLNESFGSFQGVPDLWINNRKYEWNYRRLYSNKNEMVSLAQAKDDNPKFYSGTSIQAVSMRGNHEIYNGEIWFLETNE